MRTVVLVTAVGLAAAAAAAGAYGFAVVQVPQSMAVRRVSAAEVAAAMAADRFYSDYRGDALVITAPVARTLPGQEEITLQASSTGTVSCQMAPSTHLPAAGDTVTVVTVAASAVRRADGVLLASCVLA